MKLLGFILDLLVSASMFICGSYLAFLASGSVVVSLLGGIGLIYFERKAFSWRLKIEENRILR